VYKYIQKKSQEALKVQKYGDKLVAIFKYNTNQ